MDLRFEMDTIVLLHAGPHPLATGTTYAPPDVRLQVYRSAPIAPGDACRTRCPENERGYLNTERHRPAMTHAPDTVDAVVPAGEPWMGVVRAGQLLRIVDLEGNQAVDTLFYNADDPHEHYSAQDTIRAQGNIYLTTGTTLLSNRGTPLLRIVDDTCGRHDTLGGACSAESNTVRYSLDKRHMHSCRDSFLLALAREDVGLGKRDLPSNINFFMNVPVTPEGGLDFRRWHLRGRSPRGTAGTDGCAGADLQLPAAQQPLQRLQPHAGPGGHPQPRLTIRSCSTRSWSPIAAQLPAASCARCAACRSPPWPSIPRRTRTHCMCARPTNPFAWVPRPRRKATCNQERIIEIALACGAQAIHPGYGFLSENAAFAQSLRGGGNRLHRSHTPEQMRDFGLKHTARALAQANGLPLLPGSGLLQDIDAALAEARRIGYPVMLKSTAGGGGIGMQQCHSPDDLQRAFESVRRLASNNFRDSGVFLEKYLANARHIEVQIFGDGKGTVIALGERDCSIQRRNQKVIEETPAPGLSTATREALHAAAVRLGSAVNYRSAGTVEFVFDADSGEFYFLEVNTRLQVEHGVTEEVGGIDLVEWMIRVAAGTPPALGQPSTCAAGPRHPGARIRRRSGPRVPPLRVDYSPA